MVNIVEIDKKRYIIALLITMIVFILGVLVGFLLTDTRTSYFEDITLNQRLDYQSLQLQQLYISETERNQTCLIISKTTERSLTDLEDTRRKLEKFIADSKTKNKEYEIIKREYMLNEIRFWLLSKKSRDICKEERATVLYFYSNVDEKCPDCGAQGVILSYLRNKFKGKLLVFSLDANYESEPMISILKDVYNVESYPTVVVEETVYQGLTNKETLIQELCSSYLKGTEECISNS